MTMSVWNVIRTKYLDVLFDAYIMKLKINVEINYKSNQDFLNFIIYSWRFANILATNIL